MTTLPGPHGLEGVLQRNPTKERGKACWAYSTHFPSLLLKVSLRSHIQAGSEGWARFTRGKQGGQREQWNQASTAHTRLCASKDEGESVQGLRQSERIPADDAESATGREAQKQPESCSSIPGESQGSRHQVTC